MVVVAWSGSELAACGALELGALFSVESPILHTYNNYYLLT